MVKVIDWLSYNQWCNFMNFDYLNIDINWSKNESFWLKLSQIVSFWVIKSLIFLLLNCQFYLKFMERTTSTEFQNLLPMTVPNYYKMMKVDEFLRQTIARGKTTKEASELLDVSPSTINRYKKSWGISSNRKSYNRTPEAKQLASIKAKETKERNRLFKEEMSSVDLLPSSERLSKL